MTKRNTCLHSAYEICILDDSTEPNLVSEPQVTNKVPLMYKFQTNAAIVTTFGAALCHAILQV